LIIQNQVKDGNGVDKILFIQDHKFVDKIKIVDLVIINYNFNLIVKTKMIQTYLPLQFLIIILILNPFLINQQRERLGKVWKLRNKKLAVQYLVFQFIFIRLQVENWKVRQLN
jgi:hypothetical protein